MVGFMKSALNLLGIKKGSEGAAVGIDEFLSGLPAQLGYNVSFNRKENGATGIHYEVEGEEVDSFLGTSSEVLDALSHLAMRVQRRNEGVSNEPVSEESKESLRIIFDAGGFRDKKAQELRDLAAEKRQKVLDAGGKPSYISALSPSDRKIIHTHLADFGDVVSESIGKGNFKRIRVRMKDDTRQYSDNEGGGEQRQAGERSHNSNGGGGRGGQRGGRRSGGRGGNGGGGRGGQRGGRNYNGNSNGGMRRGGGDADGNRIEASRPETDNLDDNVGNRLRPGEESPFFKPYGNFGHDQNND